MYLWWVLDEIEKAHPDVFNILLQVLDDGRITDSQGRTVDFKNTIIILTSNLGSPYILDGINADGEISEEARQKVDQLLKQSFRPEFLNRIDDIVVFSPLTEAQITGIIDIAMKGLTARLADRDIKLILTEEAKKYIAEESYTPAYGARPVKRFLQKYIETELAEKIIKGEIKDGDTVTVNRSGSSLEFAVGCCNGETS